MAAFSQGSLIEQTESIATAGGTTTLVNTNKTWLEFTGSASQTVVLPNATTLTKGRRFHVKNAATSGKLTINANGGGFLATVLPGAEREFFIRDVSSAAGLWLVSIPVDQGQPMRLSQGLTPDTMLYIYANKLEAADRTTTSIAPADSTLVRWPDASSEYGTLDFSNGAVTPIGDPILNANATYTLNPIPSSTIGNFRRVVFSYVSTSNKVDSAWSAEAASQAALSDPGVVFSNLSGVNLGYVDVQAVTVNTYKTAGSSSTVIENFGITKFSSGAGAGGGGDTSLKAQAISANVMTLKKGFLLLDDGKMLGIESDLVFNLNSAVNTLGVTAPGNNTAYTLYLDLSFLPAATTAISASGLDYYAITSGTSSMLTVLAADPAAVDLSRYVPLASLKTDGSSNYTGFSDYPRRRHQKTSVAVSPLVYEDADHSIGTVGSSGQLATYGALSTADAPTPSTAHVYSLSVNGNDANGTPINLTAGGTPSFNSVGFFNRESTIRFDGVDDQLSSTSSVFNIGNVAFSVGGWFKCDGFGNYGMIGNWNAGVGWIIFQNATGTIQWYYGAGSSSEFGAPALKVGTWNHFAMTYTPSGTAWGFFINGQRISTSTGTASSPGTFFRIGAYGSAATAFYKGSAQDCFFFLDTLTDAQVNNLYSKRFKGRQLAGGHILQADSFPLASLTNKATFWNLSASNADGSGNSKALSGGVDPVFTGLNIFGASGAAKFNGSTHTLAPATPTDSFFNPEPSQNFAYGGWFASDTWSVGVAIGNWVGGPGWMIEISSATVITTYIGSSASFATTVSLVPGSWHHLASTYNAATAVWTFYLDGVAVGSRVNGSWTTSTSAFRISGRGAGPVNYFAGRAQDCFFIKDYAVTDADIRKLYSARVDLTGAAASVISASQQWQANLLSEDGLGLSDLSGQAFVVDKSPAGKVWMDFGGATTSDPATRVNLKLFDSGLGATTVPVRKFQRSFVAAITDGTTIVHGLPSAPTNFSILHNSAADGKYKPIDAEGYIRADGTNIYLDGFGALTIDATRDLIVIASCGVPAIGIDVTTLANAVRYTAVKTANYTASNWEKVLTDSSAGAFTVTLPPTPAVGDTVEVYDGTESWAAFNVTLGRNGSNINSLVANFVCNVAGKAVKAVYISSAQGWRIYA